MNLVSAKLQSSEFAFAISSSVTWSPSYSVPCLSTSSSSESRLSLLRRAGTRPSTPVSSRSGHSLASPLARRVQFCRSLRRTDVDKAWMPKTRSTYNFLTGIAIWQQPVHFSGCQTSHARTQRIAAERPRFSAVAPAAVMCRFPVQLDSTSWHRGAQSQCEHHPIGVYK